MLSQWQREKSDLWKPSNSVIFAPKKNSQILKSMLEHGLYRKVESLKREKSLYKSSIYAV